MEKIIPFHMLYGKKRFFHTKYVKFVYMLYGNKVFVYTTCGKVAYIFYGKVVYIFQYIQKYVRLYRVSS